MTAFKYYLGLDMGTNSVGWAATDPEYRLLKAKGKDLWGIREFNEASGAVERRTHRISRRRRQREQVRIGILKDYFHDAICEVDPSFFRRLENSKYHEEDKDVEVRYKNNIFNDGNYTDKDYFNEYPTIYHLRNELISSTEKHDVRLVFLALLNMFKHRGHFLNAGLGENNGESNIDNAYFELTELLSELTEYHLSQDIDCKQIEAILSRRDMSRTHKAEELAGVLHVDLKNKPYKELIRGLCGLKFNACVVFPDVQSEEVTKLDICLSESSFDEKSDEIANIIGEDYFEIIMAMKEMFDIGSLASIMKGHNYLSQARVASYTKHKEDLKLLKEVIKKYCGKKEYDKFFNSDADGSYASYVGSYNSKNKERRVGNKRTSEELYKEIKKLLKDAPKEDENVQKILTSIENETFLPKQLTASNGVIPNQVHAREMKKILSNAENYLPFLTEKDETGLSVSERILKLFTFQIPYYVGPTSENSGKNGGNGWVVRREDGQVLPWNIDEKIDMKATSEAFISRMVRRCTYISGEQVLPKASLEYQSYCVLNEINNIKIDGERISVELKQDIYKAVFQKGKKVTKKQLCKYLHTRGIIETEEQVTGVDVSINNALTTYGKFKPIFGEDISKDSVQKMIEDIVFYSVAPMPLLLYLLKKEMFVSAAEPSTQLLLSECRKSIAKSTYGAGKTAASTAVKAAGTARKMSFLSTAAGKAVIGIVATVSIASAVTVGVISYNKSNDKNATAQENVPAVEEVPVNADQPIDGVVEDTETTDAPEDENGSEKYADIPESVLPSSVRNDKDYFEFWDEPVKATCWIDGVKGTIYADWDKTQIIKEVTYDVDGYEDELLIIGCTLDGGTHAIAIYNGQYVVVNDAMWDHWYNGKSSAFD